jgi:hypothetical protein
MQKICHWANFPLALAANMTKLQYLSGYAQAVHKMLNTCCTESCKGATGGNSGLLRRIMPYSLAHLIHKAIFSRKNRSFSMRTIVPLQGKNIMIRLKSN